MSSVEHLRTPSYLNEVESSILTTLLQRYIDVEALVVGRRWVDIIYKGKLPKDIGKVFRNIRENGIKNYCEQPI